ncbi:polynucleotide kinase 3-phosphatase [Pelomyxa schiedti]|nr:polynucleotide kinase 3-phosphatase [Pelomyxa schiedti]
MAARRTGGGGSGGGSAACWLVVLVGVPGSGKSHLATALEQRGWIRVNQDDLGTSDECMKLMQKSLKHRRSVILDRCNGFSKERRMWIREAQKFAPVNFEVVHLNVPIDECKRRVSTRRNHPTLHGPDASNVIDEFSRTMQPPNEHEGFSKIHVITDTASAAAVVRTLSGYSINLKDR